MRIPTAIAERVRRSAETIAAGLDIIGAFAIEFFLCADRLLVNEIAPRVHNTGQLLARRNDDLANTKPTCVQSAICRWFSRAHWSGRLSWSTFWAAGMAINSAVSTTCFGRPDVSLQIYGKTHAALRRKMGHLTMLGNDADDALRKAERARAQLPGSIIAR